MSGTVRLSLHAPSADYRHRRTAAFANQGISALVSRSHRPSPFDAELAVARLKAQSSARRRFRRRGSRLDRFANELIAMRHAGATTEELRRWLLGQRVRVCHSTVGRWLRRNGVG